MLGIVSTNLEDQLKLSFSALNHQDSSGRTPLSWAAGKGSAYLVRRLLQYGAAVGIADNVKATPLLYAARAGDPECLRLLLDHGADVNTRNYRGRTPLHFAAAYSDNLHSLKLLIDAGADVNAEESSENETPIIWACERDKAQIIAFLIERRATLEVEQSRNTALRAAVVANAYQTLPILLRQGPNYMRKYPKGETILHIVASKADQRMLEILADGGPFPGLDTEAKNNAGDTALDVFKKRYDITPDLTKSFQRLIRTIGA